MQNVADMKIILPFVTIMNFSHFQTSDQSQALTCDWSQVLGLMSSLLFSHINHGLNSCMTITEAFVLLKIGQQQLYLSSATEERSVV